MEKYEFLPHTADAKFVAYGKDLEEAFANSALATFALITDIGAVEGKTEKIIEVAADKKEKLLYDFLEDLLFYVDTEGFLLHEVKDLKITEADGKFHLKAVVSGDSGDYEIYTQIKAVTYSDMFIKEEDGKVTIQVVLDI